MNEKTKKILKVSAIALGEMALLTLGFAVGACSAKAGTKQQTAITTPVAKSLIKRPKKATAGDLLGTWTPNISVVANDIELIDSYEFKPYFLYEGETYNNLWYEVRSGGSNDLIYDSASNKRPKFALPGIYFASIIIPSSNGNIRIFDTSSSDIDTGHWSHTSNITILSVDNVTNLDIFGTFMNNFFTKNTPITPPSSSESTSSEPVTSEPETSQPESSYSIPDPIPLPDTLEKIVLNASYDFRRWFGNVDPTTGAIQYKLPTGASLVSVRVGGLTWENLGNERVYNCIEFTLQPFNSSNALVVSDGLAKTAQQLYGDKYNEFCMLSGVYYSYQSGYDGTYTTITDSALPSVDYRDRIYSMPMVSAQLDGTTENINALDIRNCVIPSVYRTFGISQDDGVVFSTNGYSSVTTRQLLGMDFSSVVNYSEGTASAFSLLTQAFGSVAGLLAVQVLPNITLGLLLFLPLIGAVIVLVIKAVKK